MMVFVADQVGSAEYLLPLFLERKETGSVNPVVFGNYLAVEFLGRNGIPCNPTSGMDGAAVNRIISEYHPERVILSTAGTREEQLFLDACLVQGVSCTQYIDQWGTDQERFRRQLERRDLSQAARSTDILVIDKDGSATLENLGIPGERIAIIGHPWIESQSSSNVAEPSASTVVLLTQPVSKAFGKTLGFDEADFIVACLQSWQAVGRSWSDIHIVVHPAEDLDKYRRLASAYSEDVACIRDSERRESSVGLMLGMFSSVMNRSVMQGIPTASVQPAGGERDVCHLSALGFIPRFVDGDSLSRFLAQGPAAWRDSSRAATAHIQAVVEGSLRRLEDYLDSKDTEAASA